MKISNAKVRRLLEFGIALAFAVGTSFLAQALDSSVFSLPISS